jgi:hypothetical protein
MSGHNAVEDAVRSLSLTDVAWVDAVSVVLTGWSRSTATT